MQEIITNNRENENSMEEKRARSSAEDLGWIVDYHSGQTEVFGAIYDKYVRKIYDFIYFKTHHKETAEDLCSRVFMKCLEHIANYDAQKGSFSSWLYRIATNTVIDHYRTQKSNVDIVDAWDIASSEDVARDVENRDQFSQVQKYLADLKPEQREIIILRIWNDLSYKEIAEIIGKSEDNCKMIFSRAVGTMRKEVLLAFLIMFFGR